MTCPPTSPTDTASAVVLAKTTLVDDLQPLVPLILDEELRDEVLATLDAPSRLAAEEVFVSAKQLTALAGWSDADLVTALGCELENVGQLRTERQRLERCRDFMVVVRRHVGLLDTEADRRQVVVESARLLKAIGGDAGLLKELLETEHDGYTAIDFIRLGELEAASEQVRDLANPDWLGHRSDQDPYAGAARVHISTFRIDMLLSGERDVLGKEVANHMEVHIHKTCRDGCPEAYRSRKARRLG